LTKPGEPMPTTTFKTRFRTLVAIELLGYRRQGYFWGLVAAVAMSWASPALAVAVAGSAMGLIAFSFCQSEQADPVFADFVLTRAVRRREVFAAKAVLSAAVGVVVVTCALVWKDWLPCVDDEFQVDNASLAFPYFYLVFSLCWSLCAVAMMTFGSTSVPAAVALFLVVTLGGLLGAVWIGTCDTDRVSASAVAVTGFLGCFAVGLCIAAVSAFLGMESRPPQEDRSDDDWPIIHPTSPTLVTPTTARETRATVTGHKSRPDEVSYLLPLLRLEFRHLLTVPQMWVAFMYLALAGLIDEARILFVIGSAVLVSGATLTTNLSTYEFLLSLPVSRRLQCRAKIATGLLILTPVLIVFTLWGSLWTGQRVTVPLPHRAAGAVNAEMAEGEFHWYHASPRFPGEPGDSYYYYTVPDGRLAYALARSCIVIMWYALSWMPWLAMSRRLSLGETRTREGPARGWISAVGATILVAGFIAFAHWGGPVIAWAFVLAYKYPVPIVAATLAISALLLRLPERRFANLEVIVK
jgi:hypothetical protein